MHKKRIIPPAQYDIGETFRNVVEVANPVDFIVCSSSEEEGNSSSVASDISIVISISGNVDDPQSNDQNEVSFTDNTLNGIDASISFDGSSV